MDFHADHHFPIAGRAPDKLGSLCGSVHYAPNLIALAVPLRASRARGKPRSRCGADDSWSIRTGRLARAFRRAERAVAGQDLNEGAVGAHLLRAPICLRVALI